MAGRHLRKTEFARQCRQLLFVSPVAISVHQHDGDCANAIGFCALQLATKRIEIHRAFDGAVGAHALVDLHHALVQHVRFDDVTGKDFRPRLVADA